MTAREVDGRGNCSKCGGTHYGSYVCPMQDQECRISTVDGDADMADMTPRDRALAGEIVKVSTDMHRNLLNELAEDRKEIERLTNDMVPRTRYDACNRDWLAAEDECKSIAARAETEIKRLNARIAELERKGDA